MNESNSFLNAIDQEFVPDPHESVFLSLFQQYERMIFSSIITAFGLDLLIKDQYGGDVDTIHNVRQIQQDKDGNFIGAMRYKNLQNAQAYEVRGEYSHKLVEGKINGEETNYQRIKRNARSAYNEDNQNTVQDAYEDRPLQFLGNSKNHPTDQSAELDHVIAAQTIHHDRGRVLSGLTTRELADAEENLQWTNEHLNRSMQADEIPDYIAAHPELPDDMKARMMEYYIRAKESYEKKLAKAYYLDLKNPNCKRFYLDTAKAAAKRGLQMGARQVLGFVLTEVWFTIKDELSALDDRSPGAVLDAILRGIKNGFEQGKHKYRGIISKFGEGMVSGIMASVSTTLCNIFFTTSQNLGRVIRQAWSSIVEATKTLLFNPQQRWFNDRLTDSMKVLASGAAVIIGTTAQEAMQVKLSTVPYPLHNIISTFSGSLCTGLLTVTFLFYIDHNPFGMAIDSIYNPAIQSYQEQARLFVRYCAELQKLDMDAFAQQTDQAYSVAMKLCSIRDSSLLNAELKQAMVALNITSPWGEGSLDSFMNDPNQRLVFQ